MKKIVSALFLALVGMGMVFAQDLTVIIGGQEVSEGATVTVNGSTTDVKAQIQLTNNTEASMVLIASVDASTLPEGAMASVCGFGLCAGTESVPGLLLAGDTYGDDVVEDLHVEYISEAKADWTAPLTIRDTVSGYEFKANIDFKFEEVVAEDLAVMIDGQSISNGATVTVNGSTTDVKAQIQLTNNTEASMVLIASVDASTLPEGSMASVCGFGLCAGTESVPGLLLAGDTYGDDAVEDLHVEYISEAKLNWSAPLTIRDTVSGYEFKATVDFVFDVANEGLDAAEISAYPNPASEEVHFMLANVKAGSNVVLRDMSGRVLKTVAVNGESELSLNVEGLNAGVYFYSVEENGKAVVTRKLVVR